MTRSNKRLSTEGASGEPRRRAQAKAVPQNREVSEGREAAVEPTLPEVVPMPDEEHVSALVPMVAAPLSPPDPVDGGRMQASAPRQAAKAVASEHVIDRLRGMTLIYWQDHLERSVAAGQAIMTCGSPQVAIRLHIRYLQSSLRSGFAQASDLARLSTEIARDVLVVR